MKRIVWIVSEGSPGHVSQSVGLVAALEKRIPLESVTVETRPRLGGIARTLVRARMGRHGRPLTEGFLRRWLRCESPSGKPDLLVASGGKSVFAARTLAARTGAPLVFLGERKPYRSSWFHTVFTPSTLESDGNDVSIEMIPTAVSRESVETAAANWPEKPGGPLRAMIIGGPSVSHRYTRRDWEALASGLNAAARRDKVRWLLTTSRRTTAEVETWLRDAIDPEALADAIWWADKPEKKMAAFLGAAEAICVTQDSVTMVTESVASGRPVVVVRPETATFAPASFLPGYFERLETRRRIARLRMADLAGFSFEDYGFKPLAVPVQVSMAETLIERLGWRN